MSIVGDVRIKVSTDALINKADVVSQNIIRMENCFAEMESIINRTAGYWIGEAGNMHRQIYREEIPTIEEMIKRLKEHPRDLIAIAQNYMVSEQNVREITNALAGNVIE